MALLKKLPLCSAGSTHLGTKPLICDLDVLTDILTDILTDKLTDRYIN